MSPAQALAQPRIHHQWFPDVLMVEKTLPPSTREKLAKMGHSIHEMSGSGVSQIIARSPDGKVLLGAVDPRAGGAAAGW